MRARLDRIVVDRRLVRSRTRAQRMIEAGRIRVNGQVVTRPGHPTDLEAEIEILSWESYVSRGGEKLDAALGVFRIDPSRRVCLDVGASTGGFTDCLLQHGAARVHAVDVGHGQLHPRLRSDPRVAVREGLNARYLEPQDIGEPIELATIDVSFISLRLILPSLIEVLAPGADLIALVKPQFEVGPVALPSDGVVRSIDMHDTVLAEIRRFIETDTPWAVVAQTTCPIKGEKGNVEFFLHIQNRAADRESGGDGMVLADSRRD